MKTTIAKKEGKLVVAYEISTKHLNILKFAVNNDYSNKDEASILINLGLLEVGKNGRKTILIPTNLGKKALRTMELIGVDDLCILRSSGWKIPIKAVRIDGNKVYASLRQDAVFFLQKTLRHASPEEIERYNESKNGI